MIVEDISTLIVSNIFCKHSRGYINYLIVSNYFLLSFDEKRYTSAIVEPPVPKLYFAQMDALNDCLVIENLANVGDGDGGVNADAVDGGDQ